MNMDPDNFRRCMHPNIIFFQDSTERSENNEHTGRINGGFSVPVAMITKQPDMQSEPDLRTILDVEVTTTLRAYCMQNSKSDLFH